MRISVELFLRNPDDYLEAIKPGHRIEIGDRAVLIHPEELRYLEKCVELVDALPIEIEDEEL